MHDLTDTRVTLGPNGSAGALDGGHAAVLKSRLALDDAALGKHVTLRTHHVTTNNNTRVTAGYG